MTDPVNALLGSPCRRSTLLTPTGDDDKSVDEPRFKLSSVLLLRTFCSFFCAGGELFDRDALDGSVDRDLALPIGGLSSLILGGFVAPIDFSTSVFFSRHGSDFLFGRFDRAPSLARSELGFVKLLRVSLSLPCSCFNNLLLSRSLRNLIFDALSALKHCSCRGFG